MNNSSRSRHNLIKSKKRKRPIANIQSIIEKETNKFLEEEEEKKFQERIDELNLPKVSRVNPGLFLSEEQENLILKTTEGGKRRRKKKRRKTKRRKTKRRKKRKSLYKRKKSRTRRKQRGGSNFKKKLLNKIIENEKELKNLYNNFMERYYRGKRVVRFEDLTNIIKNMDEKKLIIAAQKIGKLIKEEGNTKNKLGKILRGGDPTLIVVFVINSICGIFTLLFYLMYSEVFPDEVKILYLFLAGGREGIRNRHSNLTDEQIENRIEEKSKEFEKALALLSHGICLLGALNFINQIDEPPQRSFMNIFDISRMLEDYEQGRKNINI